MIARGSIEWKRITLIILRRRDKRKIGDRERERKENRRVILLELRNEGARGRRGCDPRRDGSLRTIRYWKVFRIRGNHEGCYQVVGVT